MFIFSILSTKMAVLVDRNKTTIKRMTVGKRLLTFL